MVILTYYIQIYFQSNVLSITICNAQWVYTNKWTIVFVLTNINEDENIMYTCIVYALMIK